MSGKSIKLRKVCYETFPKYCPSPPSPATQELQRVVPLYLTTLRDSSSLDLPYHFLKPCGLRVQINKDDQLFCIAEEMEELEKNQTALKT